MKGWLASPFRVAGGLVVAIIVAWVILLKIPSGDYLFVPDIAHPVAPLVDVVGGKPAKDGGELLFVDVEEVEASEFDVLFRSWLHPHSTVVPTKELFPPGYNNTKYIRLGLQEMSISKDAATIVAERHLGFIKWAGTRVDKVDPRYHARGILHRGDVITAVNGTPTPSLLQLHTSLSGVKPGTFVSLRIRRGSATRTVRVETSAEHGQTIVGINVSQVTKVIRRVKVKIDSGNIGGPSAGLAFTLEILQRFGENVTHGYRIAATGEMNVDGTVSAIGGVEQKTYGVREAGAQVFLVPVDGGNAKEAERYAGPNLRIIPVTSLDQALRALAIALPKLR